MTLSHKTSRKWQLLISPRDGQIAPGGRMGGIWMIFGQKAPGGRMGGRMGGDLDDFRTNRGVGWGGSG